MMSSSGIENLAFDGEGFERAASPTATLSESPLQNGLRFETFHLSTAETRREKAVCVRNAYKHYGSSKNPNRVLQNLSMTVPKGTIYGLLGASGCGKTTLLSCLVGRRRLNSGEIWVLGGKPGTKESGIPGRRVGYMPQEIALFAEFSIRETMMYFGWIFSMETKEIQERLDFLLKFLDLPSQNRLVKNLSGGQQRRVSFAVALMHDPELLILDEPTVGVDPLLRQSIWNHLVQITKDGNKTVIITTHYIEEARQAHCIGLMRSGRLLAEESPSALLATYNCNSLEEVFLMLSRNDNDSTEQESHLSSNLSMESVNWEHKKDESVYGTEETGIIGLNFHQSREVVMPETTAYYNMNSKEANRKTGNEYGCCRSVFRGKMRALLQKNFMRLWRNVGVMLIIVALPVMQVILFCLAVGRTPTNLHLAIVNEEMNMTTKECPIVEEVNYYCNPEIRNLSCHYVDMLPKESIVKDYYDNIDDALKAVKLGKAWGAMYFSEHFSEFLVYRSAHGKSADEELINGSTIRVWLDMSNQQLGLILQRDLQYSFRDFSQWLLSKCERSIKLGDLPIQQQDPIYGSKNLSFRDFVAPGVVLTVIFFLAVALTSSALIIDRMEGLQDRSWVAGVSPGEILISHVLTQFVVMLGQAILVLVFMFAVFGVECNGNLILILILTALQGLTGMAFGFVISAVCELERNAIQMALGSFYPILMLSGVIWPVEGMPTAMRYISYGLPLTLATSSLRSMTSRGWSIDEPEVYYGFIATSAWVTLFLALSFIIMKMKKS